MFKFVEGDKVKIRSDLIGGGQYGDKYKTCIPRFLMGAEGIILEVDYDDNSCRIVFNDEEYRWIPFEVITHIKKKKQFNGLEVD